jgi:UDP-N-acetylmuramoyl-L-alanyl-D-glutamate--2,6-diaminopimelate ligase
MNPAKRLLTPLVNSRTKPIYHWSRAAIANLAFGFPSRGMLVIGVTGTKGKTTTCHFLASILEEAGFTVGMATTVSFKIGSKEESNDTNMSVTAPFPLQRLLRRMRRAKCSVLVLEVTSIALDQFRTLGIPFRYVGFTNLTHDHLDYHGTMDHYAEAKLRLFRRPGLRTAAINLGDPRAKQFLEATTAQTKISYGLGQGEVSAEDIKDVPDGIEFTLRGTPVQLHLPGRFSVENALCAAALGVSLGVSLGSIARGLGNLGHVAGRLEKIAATNGATLMVDYAHTPDSLEKLYSTLRAGTTGRLIAVLGATGDRDRTKRPIMGALAGRLCDLVFITDEEPYTENPIKIIDEVAGGVPRGRAVSKAKSGEGEWWWKIPDRREAISRAVDIALPGDLVLVTGMGAQNYRKVGEVKQPWNDAKIIRAILAEKRLL